MSVPSWLTRPKYSERVVASDKGWIVERTGEVLVSVVNMREKINQYFCFPVIDVPSEEEPKEPVIVLQASKEPENQKEKEKEVQVTQEPPKKKRGRPRKNPEAK